MEAENWKACLVETSKGKYNRNTIRKPKLNVECEGSPLYWTKESTLFCGQIGILGAFKWGTGLIKVTFWCKQSK